MDFEKLNKEQLIRILEALQNSENLSGRFYLSDDGKEVKIESMSIGMDWSAFEEKPITVKL